MNQSTNFEKKFCIIFDTNMVYNSLDFNDTNQLKGVPKIIYDVIKKSEIENIVDLLIPDLVIEEERKHYIDNYKNHIKNLETSPYTNLPGLSIHIDKSINIEKFTDHQLVFLKENLFKNYKILTDMNMTDIFFTDILNRALLKKAPFEGKQGKSDKGFKDAVLWGNILRYREERPYYNIVFLSSDKIFKSILEEEYFNKFGEPIKIFNKVKELEEYITTITENVSDELIEEIKRSELVRLHLDNSELDLFKQLKEALMKDETYGPGIIIYDIINLNIINLVPSEYSSYVVDGDYYAHVNVQLNGLVYDDKKIVNVNSYLDISLNDNNNISLKLNGITMSANDYE